MQRHIDPDEAQEVVRLAAQQTDTPHEGPTVEGLAEALGLSIEEVERLLAQVRSQRSVTPAPPATLPTRSFGDRSAAVSAAIVLALVLVVATCVAFFFVGVRRTSVPIEEPFAPKIAPPSFEATTGGPIIETPPLPPAPSMPSSPGDVTIVGEDGQKTEIKTSPTDGSVTIRSHEAPQKAKSRTGSL